MEILERCYEDSLERVGPLTTSLATFWEQTFIDSFTASQSLKQLQAEKDQELARFTKQSEQFQKMNAALLEENTILKRDIETMRKWGTEPSRTPMSEDARSLHSGPLPSPAMDLDVPSSDPFLLCQSGSPSIAVSPPELDYAEIMQEQTDHSDAVILSRLYSEVTQTQALLDNVQTRRLSVMQSLDAPVRNLRHKRSRSLLPRISSSAPLWKDVSHPAMQDPRIRACILVQTCWRGFAARKAYKCIKLRLMIVNEMLDTEASFVKGLLSIHKDFMIPLKEEMNSKAPLITRQDFDIIFRYVAEIMAFNQGLLDSLVNRVAFWHHEQILGDVFMRAAESMKLYAHFVNNYDQAVEKLNKVSENPAFERKLQDIKKGMGSRSPDLTDLLITPVQRPPRYLLLLKELLKRTPNAHPDYSNLVAAVQKVERTVQAINERKKRHEMMKKMQDAFIGNPINLITPGRFLTHSGPLLELNEASTGTEDLRQKRMAFLFSDVLVAAAGVGTPEVTAFRFLWALPLADIVGVAEGSGESDCVRVSWRCGQNQGVKVLYGRNREEHLTWLQTLTNAVRNVSRLPRQPTLQGAGLILPPSNGHPQPRQKSLQTINRTIQKLETEIQQENKVMHGYAVLETLQNQRSGGGESGEGWIGRLNERMSGRAHLLGRQKEESERRIMGLRGEVSRQTLKLQLQFDGQPLGAGRA
ncbi:hypothetical protein HKX48_008051 [Thoreauomyces humboldtii]|nr:hypothetical protein HKX48_008051 [Thoreauomyces humboldtii]